MLSRRKLICFLFILVLCAGSLTVVMGQSPTNTPPADVLSSLEVITADSTPNLARLWQTNTTAWCLHASADDRLIMASNDASLSVLDWQSDREIGSMTTFFSGYDHGCSAGINMENTPQIAWVTGSVLTLGTISESGLKKDEVFYERDYCSFGHCEVMAVSQDGVWVAFRATGSAVGVENRLTGFHSLIYTSAQVFSAAFSPNDKLVTIEVFLGDQYHQLVYSVQGRLLLNLPTGQTSGGTVYFSADGKRLVEDAFLDSGEVIRFYDIKSGQSLRSLPMQSWDFETDRALNFSPDLSLAAILRGENTILLMDTDSGNIAAALKPGCAPCEVQSASFSPDGKLLMASIKIGGIEVWGILPGGTPNTISLDSVPTPQPTAAPSPTATAMPATATATPPAFSRSLSLTDPATTGDDVRLVQQRLHDLGYSEVGVVDGSFGKLTDAAVRHFQTQNGLAVDGVIGPKTWAQLFSDAAVGP